MNKSKYIAFYLPQFHTIPENDKWWGEGFTDWTNTKKSVPLFRGHNQPRTPLNDNYYDLANVDTLRWQAALAEEFGVYGFCFYHYWFKGKMLLEKPAEILLANEDVNVNFCFSWANETWSKTWNGTEKNVLISQDYGDNSDWENHIRYLIPFFKDERYIKIGGRPVFLIYNLAKIPNFETILALWNDILHEEGIEPIHLVETLNSFNHGVCKSYVDSQVEFEPWYTISQDWKLRLELKAKRLVRNLFRNYKTIPEFLHSTVSYDYVTKRALKRPSNPNLFKGVFPDWDNSARKCELKNATIISGASPEKFGKAVVGVNQLVESGECGEFVFVNAWNEWAEGAYLEPDTKFEFDYISKLK